MSILGDSSRVGAGAGVDIEAVTKSEIHAEVKVAQTVALQPGARMGRFVVVSELGQGGMGAVYTAFDPELNRKVAIKLLRPNANARHSAEATARLHREAQALARLSHPNVVSVHDVGVHEGTVFIAMEFVEGTTLGEWLSGKSRDEMLKTFDEAGQGLWAVHQAGLVHRDFKANNVMVSQDGRVKLLDLGLARRFADGESPSSSGSQVTPVWGSSESSGSFDEPLTKVGQVTGTPGYIAPEILRGDPPTALSDQFSFGVALYKALVGEMPFKGRSIESYALSVRSGPPNALPAELTVPKWLLAVVKKTLNIEPEKRFPSMDALLRALKNNPTKAKRRRAAAAILIVVLAGSAYGVIRATDSGCQTREVLLQHVWPQDLASRLEKKLISQRPQLASFVRHGLSTVDSRIRQWAVAHETTCRQHHPRFAPPTPSRRMDCLQRHRQRFEVLLDTLDQADSLTALKSAELIAGFTTDPTCESHVDRRTADDVPAQDAALARELRLGLFRAQALYLVGRYREGLTEALRVAERAKTAGLPGFEGEARFRANQARRDLGELEAADHDLRSALILSLGAAVDEFALKSAVTLTQRLSREKGKLQQAQEMQQYAEALYRRMGATEDLEVEITYGRVELANAEGRRADMVSLADGMIALAQRRFGTNSFEYGEAWRQYAHALWVANRAVESADAMRRALQIFETAMGNDDPRLVDYQTNQAHRLEAIGYDEEAGALLDQALALARRTLEPSSRQFAVIQMLLAGHLSTRDPPRAIVFANEAIQWYEKSKSPRELSLLYRVRSDALAALHRGKEALGDCETAHAALKQVADPDNAYALADARCRGVAYLSMEKFTEAASELERARTIMPQARSLAHRARLALAHARAKLALHAPTHEVRTLAEEGLKAIEAFPSTSFVKNELVSFLSTLPSGTTSRIQP